MNTEFSFHELKAAERLPTPSGLALAIMQLLQKTDATLLELAELVKGDPALTARILGFANSAAFGARRPVATVHDAVLMMGMNSVRNFALSLSLINNHRDGHCMGFDYPIYWAQALAMAVAIAAITARERTIAPEEAFTIGLLSDIGRLALATAWPETYGDCLQMSQGDDLLRLERERFAVDHKELTLILLLDWGFPSILLDALNLSTEPLAGEISRVTRLARQLAFARQIARYCIADDQYRTTLLPDLQRQAENHSLERDFFDKFINDISREWQTWGKLIEIKTDARLAFPAAPSEQTETLPGLDLLLVDDDPMMVARLSKQLTAAGHRVAACRDGEAALKHVVEHKPQMMITDWRMKPLDGLSLCKTLREADIGKNLYLIMLTATESEDALVKAFAAGIDDYVTKPVSLRVLLARIRAGQRIIMLQQEVEKEKKDIQRYTAELTVANRRLEMMANTDILTSLPNRRYALTRLEQEWETAQRYNRPLSVLMLDLDHFKSINDTLGHDAGDAVLTHSAKILKATVRASDIACRLGGEEFLVIAPNTDGTAALLLAERIRGAIQAQQPKDPALTKPITVSIGVAGSVGDKPGWKTLIKLADQALYQIKARSRNAVQLASF
ncbi:MULTISPECIES: GGDEF domain-containing response regulator [Methylomicrobium]|uniref:diguanylate cyclase n=1 Tax=Methylomicrobium album BG8 TaxID=686340 RepID=H8GNF1_METAL|nr:MULTISPECIES: diguanylate cyclase [Methylomicrobium]EIC29544.1 diguanylate cyclase (GGDEF) domain-containing protein [Methylomicrobium album BG8]